MISASGDAGAELITAGDVGALASFLVSDDASAMCTPAVA